MALTAAASLREFWPLCLVLPLQGSDTYLAFVPQLEALSESLTHSNVNGGPVSLAYGCYDPLQLRCAWWSLRPGWLLNFSLTGTYVWTFLLWTLAVPRDWVDLPSPSSHFQDSVSCLTCSYDSQLLRLPAMDISVALALSSSL